MFGDMFDLDGTVNKEVLKMAQIGSYGRFKERIKKFKDKHTDFPRVRHGFWWVMHNCVAHPIIGVLPVKKSFDFHDFTSDKINCKKIEKSPTESTEE